jgi:IS30 family transposase
MTKSNHKYTQLTIAERTKIETLSEIGYSARKIAQHIGRSHSTILREIRKGKSKVHNGKYQSHIAQKRTDLKRNRKPSAADNQDLMQDIERMLKRRWSPNIIVQKLGHIISHMTIYNIIKTIRTEWRKFLIYQRKSKYHKGLASMSLIPNRTDISERGEIKFGDWEADTVIPVRGSKCVLGVFVEKTTRVYKVVRMMNKTADEMLRATLIGLEGLPVKSITYDNGSENAAHEWANGLLDCKSYFARPYRSTDKPQIENRNKILRQFLPKGTNFDLISDAELSRIENEINERPMECLGWRSPSDALAVQFNL